MLSRIDGIGKGGFIFLFGLKLNTCVGNFKIFVYCIFFRINFIPQSVCFYSGKIDTRPYHLCLGVCKPPEEKEFWREHCLTLEIQKAFDTLDYDFLCDVLIEFRFSHTFVRWIWNMLSSSHISLLVNGSPNGYFTCPRGVRQGDPLPTLLFCLARDYLSHLLLQEAEEGRIKPLTTGRNLTTPTHLVYTDDIIIFMRSDRRSIQHLKQILIHYASTSGQEVNWTKSHLFRGSGTRPHRKREITQLIGA